MKVQRLSIETGSRRRIVDLTERVTEFLAGEGDGFVNISLPHATAGIALMELGSGSEADLGDRLDAMFPRENIYSHRHGSQGHGADHIIPAFVAPTLTLPVLGGTVSLGTWQRIAMIDTNLDNPKREVLLTFISG